MSGSSALYKAVQATGKPFKAVGRGVVAAGHKVGNAVYKTLSRDGYLEKAVGKLGDGIAAAGRGVEKPLKATGRGLVTAFNWASGNTALEKRGLDRGGYTQANFLKYAANVAGTYGGTCGVTLALAPVIGPFVIPVAAATLLTTAVGPARIQAAYRIGKHETKEAKKSNLACMACKPGAPPHI